MVDGDKQQAGVVLGRPNPTTGEVELLLISARSHPGSWVFPVGTVDEGETVAEAAGRECLEESGYRVSVGPPLATIELDKGDSVHLFTFFAATLEGEVEEYESDRQRRWVALPEVADVVAEVFRPVARAAELYFISQEEKAWEESYMANREYFRAMARQALKNLEAGETLEMPVGNGETSS